MSENHTFAYVLKLANQEMVKNMSLEQEAVVNEHFDYLQRNLAEGKLVLAGRCLNGEFGIVIFHAQSEQAAEEFMKNDPAVKKGIMTSELHSFRVALLGKE
jgi:uncharacterized protein YciI